MKLIKWLTSFIEKHEDKQRSEDLKFFYSQKSNRILVAAFMLILIVFLMIILNYKHV